MISTESHQNEWALNYDANGNRSGRTNLLGGDGKVYEWTLDNRLKKVTKGSQSVEYAYDVQGRRILARSNAGVRTRHFFTGLIEEITKTSVPGSHNDNAFAMSIVRNASHAGTWGQSVGSGGTVSAVHDDERRQEVVHFYHPSTSHNRWDSWLDPALVTGRDRRVVSLWHRRATSHGVIVMGVQTPTGTRLVHYQLSSGTDSYDAANQCYHIYLNLPAGAWHRIEQDIAADMERLTPGVACLYTGTNWLWGRDFKVGEIRFCNAIRLPSPKGTPPMAQCFRFVCSSCDHDYTVWDEGNPYVIDPDGTKRYVYHPSEDRALAVGIDIPHVCLSCGDVYNIDSNAPDLTCPSCGKGNPIAAMRLEGKRCPHCKEGTLHRDTQYFCVS